MSKLFPLLSAALPLCILEFLFRLGGLPPPRWLADALALVLLMVVAWLGLRGWREGRRSAALDQRDPARTWDPALPCLVHEIRNYSSVLKGNASLLRSRIDGEAGLEPLFRLERTSEKIEALAQEILDASSSARRPDLELLCPLALLNGCLSEYFNESRNRIIVEADGPLPAIAGDPRKLERVFLNLLRNAWEAGAKSIRIRMSQETGRVRVRIEDDGQGCSPEITARLFQPLYTTKKAKGGIGLGLYVVKSVVEAHGGTIRAVSKNSLPDSRTGMIFCLEIPVGRSEEARENRSINRDWRPFHWQA